MTNIGAVTPAQPRGMHARRPHPRAAWLLAHACAHRLDRDLASGVAGWHSPLHAARARQLTSDRCRRALARSLERLVEAAERPPGQALGAVISPCRPQVREARPLMLAIAHRLRAHDPVDARGMARLRRLLSDGTGPCYVNSRPDALQSALQAVDAWLDAPD